MSNQKLVVGIVVALFMFAAVNVQAETVILQELLGNVTQVPNDDTEFHAITSNGNASVILNGFMNNQALVVGSPITGAVSLGDLLKTVIFQNANANVTQGPRGILETEIHAIVSDGNGGGRGNATVSGGFSNTNILNSVVASAIATSNVEITQSANNSNSAIRQGMVQDAIATAHIGTALADKTNQQVSNIVNLGMITSSGTGVSMIQDAGGTTSSVQQTGGNRVSADTVTGDAIVNGTGQGEGQGVSNLINLASANGGLAATQTYTGFENRQDGYNVASAYSEQQRPTPQTGDPAITINQTVLNSANRVELVKTGTPAYLWGSQSYSGSGSDTSDSTARNRMYAEMNGIGNASATGTQSASTLANTVYVGSGGTTSDSVFTQNTTGNVYMNEDGRSSNRVLVDATTGNATTNVAQGVTASLNVISASGPLSGSFTQSTAAIVEQSMRNRMDAYTNNGNATVQGTQATTNNINVIQAVK